MARFVGTVWGFQNDSSTSYKMESGVWQRAFEALSLDAGNEYAMIDSTIVRAHQHSVGCKKKSKLLGEVQGG